MVPAGLTPVLEVDVAGTNYGDDPTFTNITEFWRASNTLVCQWGRQDWTTQVAASLTVQLKNDGRFTPSLASGAYYPNIRRRNRVRFGLEIDYTGGLTFVDAGDHWEIAASSGVVELPDHFECTVGTWIDAGDHWEVDATKTTLRMFGGYANSWDANYEGNVYALCDLTATDFLGRLSRSTPLRTMFDEEILRDNPSVYYPLNDAGPTAGDIMGTAPTMYAKGSATWQSATPAADPDVAGVYLHGAGSKLYWTTAQPIDGCFVMWYSTHSDTMTRLLELVGDELILTAGGDGKPHQLFLDNAGNLQIDGSPRGTMNVAGGLRALGVDLLGTVWGAAFYPTVLSSMRLAQQREAVLTGFAGESTADHVARLLAYRPSFGTVLDPPQGKVGLHQTAGVTLQQALLDTSAVEGGVLYTDGDQQVVMRSRSRLYNPATTVSLDVSKISGGIRFRDDILGLVNEVTIIRSGGATVRAIIPESDMQDGPSATSLNLIVDTDLNALQMAGWIAGNGAAEQTASPSLDLRELMAETDQAIVTAVLALQPLDVIELTGLPDTAPASTVRYVVQGGQLSMSTSSVSVTFYTTALPLAVFTWDDSSHGWDSGAVWAP